MAEIHTEPALRSLRPGYEDAEENLRAPLTAVGRAAVARTGVEMHPLRQKTSAGHKIDFQPDAVRVLKQHIVVTRRPGAFQRAANDLRAYQLEQSGAAINVFA